MRGFSKGILILLVIASVCAACAGPFHPRLIQGSGNVIVEDRAVSGFDRVLVSGAGTVILTQGDEESLSIETDDNLLKYIRTEVKGDTLEIDFTDGTMLSPGSGISLDPTRGLIFRISVIELKGVQISGAADIEVEKLKTDRFEVNFSGAGSINIDDLNADRLEVEVSGAGDISLAGKVTSQDITLSGLGRYGSFDLESQSASVTISGAGGADLWVTGTLDVVISGAGDVEYFGEPSVNPQISGLGRIQGLGEK